MVLFFKNICLSEKVSFVRQNSLKLTVNYLRFVIVHNQCLLISRLKRLFFVRFSQYVYFVDKYLLKYTVAKTMQK